MATKTYVAAAVAIGSGITAGVAYRTAVTTPLLASWSLAHFEWIALITAFAFGIIAGAVSCQPWAVAVAAALGLFAAAVELETHTDVSVGTLLAIDLAFENQGHWLVVFGLALSAGAFVGKWLRGKASVQNAVS